MKRSHEIAIWIDLAVALYFAMPYITKFFMYVTRFGY